MPRCGGHSRSREVLDVKGPLASVVRKDSSVGLSRLAHGPDFPGVALGILFISVFVRDFSMKYIGPQKVQDCFYRT